MRREERQGRLVEIIEDDARFCSVFATWVERDVVSIADHLVDDLELDSLDLFYLLTSIEELARRQLTDEHLSDIGTVGQVQQAILGLLRE